jgi:hypothetical protein
MKVRCAHSNAVNSMALAGIIWGRDSGTGQNQALHNGSGVLCHLQAVDEGAGVQAAYALRRQFQRRVAADGLGTRRS